jgi:hypothetical protein
LTSTGGLFRMADPADRVPSLAAPFPLRSHGVGLAFADLLVQATDKDRGSGEVTAKALGATMMFQKFLSEQLPSRSGYISKRLIYSWCDWLMG